MAKTLTKAQLEAHQSDIEPLIRDVTSGKTPIKNYVPAFEMTQVPLEKTLGSYIAMLVSRANFTTDFIVDVRNVVSRARERIPSFPEWAAQEYEFLKLLDAAAQSIQTVSPMPTVRIRVSVSAAAIGPSQLPMPGEQIVVWTLNPDPKALVINQGIINPSDNIPSLKSMLLPKGGAMFMVEPMEPLINNKTDLRGSPLSDPAGVYEAPALDRPANKDTYDLTVGDKPFAGDMPKIPEGGITTSATRQAMDAYVNAEEQQGYDTAAARGAYVAGAGETPEPPPDEERGAGKAAAAVGLTALAGYEMRREREKAHGELQARQNEQGNKYAELQQASVEKAPEWGTPEAGQLPLSEIESVAEYSDELTSPAAGEIQQEMQTAERQNAPGDDADDRQDNAADDRLDNVLSEVEDRGPGMHNVTPEPSAGTLGTEGEVGELASATAAAEAEVTSSGAPDIATVNEPQRPIPEPVPEPPSIGESAAAEPVRAAATATEAPVARASEPANFATEEYVPSSTPSSSAAPPRVAAEPVKTEAATAPAETTRSTEPARAATAEARTQATAAGTEAAAGTHLAARGAEAPRAETSRAATPAHTSRAEPVRAESASAEQSTRAEAQHTETSRAETSRSEPAGRSEAASEKIEQPHAESSRSESSRPEPARAESARSESTRAEPARQESSQGNTSNAESAGREPASGRGETREASASHESPAHAGESATQSDQAGHADQPAHSAEGRQPSAEGSTREAQASSGDNASSDRPASAHAETGADRPEPSSSASSHNDSENANVIESAHIHIESHQDLTASPNAGVAHPVGMHIDQAPAQGEAIHQLTATAPGSQAPHAVDINQPAQTHIQPVHTEISLNGGHGHDITPNQAAQPHEASLSGAGTSYAGTHSGPQISHVVQVSAAPHTAQLSPDTAGHAQAVADAPRFIGHAIHMNHAFEHGGNGYANAGSSPTFHTYRPSDAAQDAQPSAQPSSGMTHHTLVQPVSDNHNHFDYSGKNFAAGLSHTAPHITHADLSGQNVPQHLNGTDQWNGNGAQKNSGDGILPFLAGALNINPQPTPAKNEKARSKPAAAKDAPRKTAATKLAPRAAASFRVQPDPNNQELKDKLAKAKEKVRSGEIPLPNNAPAPAQNQQNNMPEPGPGPAPEGLDI